MSPSHLRPVLFAALALLLPATAATVEAQQDFREEFLRQFDSSMSRFEALAQAMPESAYGWSPGEGVMSVARVYGHVARYNYGYPEQALGVAVPAGLDLQAMEELTSKEELVALLRQSAEHVRGVVAQGSAADWAAPTRLYGRDVPRWSVLLQLLAHMNEHLGQSIAYARMNDVVPPWSQ